MTQQKALQSLTPVFTGSRHFDSSRKPTASGNPEAVMIQERETSAQRTQADYSKRESLMSCSSQEPRAYGKTDAMFSSGSKELGNQFKSSFSR